MSKQKMLELAKQVVNSSDRKTEANKSTTELVAKLNDVKRRLTDATDGSEFHLGQTVNGVHIKILQKNVEGSLVPNIHYTTKL